MAVSGKHDFWLACGHHLLDRDAAGRLLVTDEFLKIYLARAELVPPPESCLAERRLHGILLGNPRQAVTASQIAAIADPDARENWEMMIAWRNHLVRNGTLESAYLEIVRRSISLPQVFIGQLIQVILRNVLDDCSDSFILRAAEMFFRPQKLTVEGNSIIAWDEETAASVSDRRHQSPLFALLGLPAATEADMLTDSTADSYWHRSDRFDMGFELAAGQRGSAALGQVIARWVSHLLAVDVAVEPLTELRNAPLSWYVGLTADATRIGDAIWNEDDADSLLQARLVGLYRLNFRNPSDVIEKVRGEPVYLLAGMTADEVLRLKPQNLVTGLPIRCEEAAN
jgi:Family of unknown function (DUF6352)